MQIPGQLISFDFTRKRTTILDPMINNRDRPAGEIQNEHKKLG
jgi:hypothetical protein